MRVTDRIADELEAILGALAWKEVGQSVDWDVQVGIMPTQDGQNMVIAQFFFFLKNPILGQGDLATVEIMPLALTTVGGALNGMVKRCLENLAEQHKSATALPKP